MKVQSAALAMAIAFAMISGACSSTGTTPSGSAGSSGGGTAGTTGTAGTGGPSCPNGVALRWQRGRNLERDVVVPGVEWGAGHLAGRSRSPHLQERVDLGLAQRERNVDRERQRDVHGRDDHHGYGDGPARGRMLDAFGHHL